MSAGVCESCQAPIVWMSTTTGRRMPVNPENVQPDDVMFDPKRHVSHFASCPFAQQHRVRKKKKK